MSKVAYRASVAALALIFATAQAPVQASSHREAPFLTESPKVDATDFYMFRSYESGRSGFVTIIANYIPVQAAYGGPNYFTMDPDALYEIHIDNNGDAKEDITFQFRFTNTLRDTKLTIGDKSVSVPLRFTGTVSKAGDNNVNEVESYTIKQVTGNRRTGTVFTVKDASDNATSFAKPLDYVGNKTFTNLATYNAYANSFIHNITLSDGFTGRVFVGQRKDPFRVNLGEVFDLVNFNPLGANNSQSDDLATANVTTIALELPAGFLKASDDVIGGWTTASLRQARVLNPSATFSNPAQEGGAWTQVSRLGMPLVNELVIGLPDKNKFNASKPENDAQFADYVTNPTLPAILNLLFGVTAPTTPRTDLVAVFLTGVAGVNQPENVVASEMLRLNLALPITAAGGQNKLGAALCFPNRSLTPVPLNGGCDLAGFPNGRRPGDDVVDIALDATMGYFLSNTVAPSGGSLYTDGADTSDANFDATFPYLKTPVAGSPN